MSNITTIGPSIHGPTADNRLAARCRHSADPAKRLGFARAMVRANAQSDDQSDLYLARRASYSLSAITYSGVPGVS